MSGGSFDYLFSKDLEELFIYSISSLLFWEIFSSCFLSWSIYGTDTIVLYPSNLSNSGVLLGSTQ